MAIIAAHAILHTDDPDGLRIVLGDVLGWPHVDAGHGWLIFRLPPAEVGVHPAEPGGGHHELALVCDDLETTMAELSAKGLVCGAIEDQGWGRSTTLTLPGTSVLLYQPRHPLAADIPT